MWKKWLMFPVGLLAFCALVLVAADKPAPPPILPAPPAATRAACCQQACHGDMPACCWQQVAVEAMLASPMIQIQTRVLTVDSGCFGKNPESTPMFLNESEVAQMLECVQADCRSNMLSHPRLTVMSGQDACVETCGYVPGGKQAADVPACMPSACTKLNMTANVSSDRKYVTLDFKFQCTQIPSSGPESCPNSTTAARCVMPCGQSCVICVGTQRCSEPRKFTLLSRVPYLHRLSTAGSEVYEKQVLLVLTPTLVQCTDSPACGSGSCVDHCCQPQAKTAVTPCPTGCVKPAGFAAEVVGTPLPAPTAKAPALTPVEQRASKMAERLVEKYAEALAKGDPEKARKYARQALDLDPTVFGREVRNTYSSDPNLRMNQLLNRSEDLRNAKSEWKKIWINDQPSHVPPERVQGGIQ